MVQNTIRVNLDTARTGLTSPNIEIRQYSCFWECQCIRNDSQNLPFCPGPPQNTFMIFLRYSQTIISQMQFSKFENLVIWKYETSKSLKLWNSEIFKSLKPSNFQIWSLQIFETLKSVNLWNFEICKSLKLSNFKIFRSLKLWNL